MADRQVGWQVRFGRGKVCELLLGFKSLVCEFSPRWLMIPSWETLLPQVLAYLPGNGWASEPAHLWLQVSNCEPPTKEWGEEALGSR